MTNPSSTTRSSMFIKWSCPLSHGRRFSCRRSVRLERAREDEEPRDEDENDHEDE